LRQKAKDLLAVKDFTTKLFVLDLFEDLQNFAQEEGEKIGVDLEQFFEKSNLGLELGHLHKNLRFHREDRECNSQECFVPCPPTSDSSFDSEAVYMHVLHMIALAIDADFQRAVLKLSSENNGQCRHAKPKGIGRMWTKLQSRHGHRFLPDALRAEQMTRRSGQNVDVNRNAATFETVEDLKAFVSAMEAEFDGVAKVTNDFELDDTQAATRFNYREFRMHVVWPPVKQVVKGCARTFEELVDRSKDLWDDYQLNVAEDPTFSPTTRLRYVLLARDHLQQLALDGKPLQFIVETQVKVCAAFDVWIILSPFFQHMPTQVLLRPYLEGRKAMHLICKVSQSPTDQALFASFRKPDKNDDVGKRYPQAQQEKVNTYGQPDWGGVLDKALKNMHMNGIPTHYT
jgi:hypothetical protein